MQDRCWAGIDIPFCCNQFLFQDIGLPLRSYSPSCRRWICRDRCCWPCCNTQSSYRLADALRRYRQSVCKVQPVACCRGSAHSSSPPRLSPPPISRTWTSDSTHLQLSSSFPRTTRLEVSSWIYMPLYYCAHPTSNYCPLALSLECSTAKAGFILALIIWW